VSVCFNGALSQTQLIGDIRVAQSSGNVPEYLQLAPGE
jgi:hypothetical protein